MKNHDKWLLGPADTIAATTCLLAALYYPAAKEIREVTEGYIANLMEDEDGFRYRQTVALWHGRDLCPLASRDCSLSSDIGR